MNIKTAGKWMFIPPKMVLIGIDPYPYKWISGWWLTYPPEKYESQIGSSFLLLGKIKNVPNHQPDINGRLSSAMFDYQRVIVP